VSVPVLERANRRLPHHLGGDLASVDAARILRPPESLNHKHSPPAAVELLAFDQALRYDVDELVDALPDPPGRPAKSRPAQRRAHHELDEAHLAIPAADYVAALAGLQPTRAGKVNCPFHEDRTPACSSTRTAASTASGAIAAARSTTSWRSCGAPAPSAASSSSSVPASPTSCCRPR
jgi:hypothetical protein